MAQVDAWQEKPMPADTEMLATERSEPKPATTAQSTECGPRRPAPGSEKAHSPDWMLMGRFRAHSPWESLFAEEANTERSCPNVITWLSKFAGKSSSDSDTLRPRHKHHRRQSTQQDGQLNMLAAIVKLVEVN